MNCYDNYLQVIALYLLKLNNEGDDDDDSYKDCFCGNDESDPSHCVFSLITLITYYIMGTTLITLVF